MGICAGEAIGVESIGVEASGRPSSGVGCGDMCEGVCQWGCVRGGVSEGVSQRGCVSGGVSVDVSVGVGQRACVRGGVNCKKSNNPSLTAPPRSQAAEKRAPLEQLQSLN